ncbi:phosphoribosyl-AMP cyclohydrolase [Clostridium ganghwense]|uniref:Phosphoribosyl-AMP cyclohydrolase n=1 Tax=Clostridium ganghwense TaxID=312089 RepID=A0ABT4CRD0_9CLOT|nr:phosphoribosyl-AMP cyclohydrolase [Clostridium ganghwense]MCY6371627.1 phosphoribosyl-AMP cyclohydrolase [Clostridium ganghwense]
MNKEELIKKVNFDKGNGLVPTIVQDYENGEVLMMAYMNEQSLKRTIESGTTWFWSRSRNEFWNKGATSGHFQFVKSISIDCDCDTLLIKVNQIGAACHTGNRSCFYRKIEIKGE